MSRIKKLAEYIFYFFHSKSSPKVNYEFLNNFIKYCIKENPDSQEFSTIESVRNDLLKSTDIVNVTDYGQGSKKQKTTSAPGEYPAIYSRKLADIAKYSLKTPRECLLIASIINYLKPSEIIELGTSLGITTAYMSTAYPNSSITTIEGCPETANIARQIFSKLNLNNINVINSSFEDSLDKYLQKTETVDMAFIDGNHDYAPLMSYFKTLVNQMSENGIIIIDDIRWSDKMRKAWKEIKLHEKVGASIDLFDLGILFFNKTPEKQHLMIWK